MTNHERSPWDPHIPTTKREWDIRALKIEKDREQETQSNTGNEGEEPQIDDIV